MKLPGPDHPITVTPSRERVRVLFNGQAVADTTRALVLQEASYKPVFYIPREDAQLALLEKTAHGTHCPYKGDASYYGLQTAAGVVSPAVWTYAAPHDAVAAIRDHVAFYPDKVDAIEVHTED
jgi:uncharacterized protein (DUF427 family)